MAAAARVNAAISDDVCQQIALSLANRPVYQLLHRIFVRTS